MLDSLRAEFKFRLLGWVLMPEHFHLLLWPQPAEATSRIVQQLKQHTAARILRLLRENSHDRGCAGILARLRLPASVHDQSAFRVWQRRFYPLGVYSDSKRLEKLNDMHNNPVKRRRVDSPDPWSWSSYRSYHLGDASPLKMDHMP